MADILYPGTAVVGDVLTTKTFSGMGGTSQTGSMPNNGAVTITPSSSVQTIPLGYHNGSGQVLAQTGTPAASGTTTTSSTQFVFIQDNGTSINRYKITITGLSFKPSLIEIRYITGGSQCTTCDLTLTYSSASTIAYIACGSNGTLYYFQLTGNASVTNTGFVLPYEVGNTNVSWRAYL